MTVLIGTLRPEGGRLPRTRPKVVTKAARVMVLPKFVAFAPNPERKKNTIPDAERNG
jgi:hypothetical protein